MNRTSTLVIVLSALIILLSVVLGQKPVPQTSSMPKQTNAAVQSFTGHWEWSASNYSDGPHFSLDLTQDGNTITGFHAANIDGGPPTPSNPNTQGHNDQFLPKSKTPSINGTISGNVASVTFLSSFASGELGQATLTLNPDGTLAWAISKAPKTHYLLPTAKFVRSEK